MVEAALLTEVLTVQVSTQVVLISAVTRVLSSGLQGKVARPTQPELAAPHPDGHLAHDRPSSTWLDQL